MKDKRMTKTGPEFLIGCRDFPLERDDTWEPISNLTGSEHMICEFQKQHALDYAAKTVAVLQQVAVRGVNVLLIRKKTNVLLIISHFVD